AKRICFFSFKKCCSYEPRTTTTTTPSTHKPTTRTTSESSPEISLSASNEELDNSIDIVMNEINELEFSEDELTIDDLKEAEDDTVDELNESVGATYGDSDDVDSSKEVKKPKGIIRKHKNHPRGRGRAMVLKHYCCRAGFIIAKKSKRTEVCRNRANHFVMKFRKLAGIAKRICFVSFNKCCSK
ncbi:unnamed protein product, partial [Owenia fusiformis]